MNEIIPELNKITLQEKNLGDVLNFLKIKHLGVEIDNSENFAEFNDIKLIRRVTLQEDNKVNSKNLKSLLEKNRLKFDFIIVEPQSAGFAAIAARDGRVDAIRITSNSRLKVFNTRYGRRLEENHKLVEVDISAFWNPKIAKNLRPINRIIRSFKNCDLKYILTKENNQIRDLRSYRGLQSIGRLLNLNNQQTNPDHLIRLIENNRKKRNGTIPLEGVEIINGC
jgi:RNase P/RNase MRP subunit p30